MLSDISWCRFYDTLLFAGANQKPQFSKPGAAGKAAHVLGVSTEELSRAIFSPAVTHSPTASV